MVKRPLGGLITLEIRKRDRTRRRRLRRCRHANTRLSPMPILATALRALLLLAASRALTTTGHMRWYLLSAVEVTNARRRRTESGAFEKKRSSYLRAPFRCARTLLTSGSVDRPEPPGICPGGRCRESCLYTSRARTPGKRVAGRSDGRPAAEPPPLLQTAC
jgi:hypothetical protein